ncbi:baseplate J/gp47 family protein [Tindallia californiensis]|uniref:Uncharacterized phage protein gp47/JayE n=1 Tax=Tindallia californiensis TaxID=159292 RepID=A0A1H3R1M9_9FIRM|nr:baseplate J/gp47 family protein [Tindallia californiensis]SDZ19506.1 Uncharacterized phage protein gp47/JayE [Tindallia californiensis]
MSKKEILNRLLNDVNDKYDKRPGSFIYDALAPAAEQFNVKRNKIESVEEKLNIENLSGEELEQRVKQRSGIRRRLATHAIGKVTVTGTGTIHEGDLFETENGIQFESVETVEIVDSGEVNIQSTITGEQGEVPAESITLFPVTLSGFTNVINTEPTYDGFEKESDDDLLERYYEAIRRPATSGNRAHYAVWAKEIEGVGDVKVFPLWDGDNTVKVLIIDMNRHPASTELVETVQEHLDPGIQGLGDGTAPIGAFVTVESAKALEINIVVDVILSEGSTLAEAEQRAIESLESYLFDIAFKELFVSYARLGASILKTDGISDYSDLTVNGGTVNVDIDPEEVAILGTVTLNEL